MVLSLPFILAIVGASVGLLVGILIFGEVSEAIECPAPASGGGTVIVNGTFATNQGSLSSADGEYFENDVQTDFISVAGAIGQGVYQEGTATLEDQGEIRFGSPSQWQFLHTGNVGNNVTSINFWINGDVDGSPEYPLLQIMDDPSTNDNGIYLYTQGTLLRLSGYEDSIPHNFAWANNRPPDDSNWHMVTIVMDKGNGTINLFNSPEEEFIWRSCLDSVCVDSLTSMFPFTGTGSASDSPLIFGHNNGESAITENGFALDDITVWNGYQLTQTDINDLWNGGTGSSAGATGESIALGSQLLHITFDIFSEAPAGGDSGIGSEQCEQAKDTAWTVIGIMPVALFFGLFALFSAVMPRPT